jgi:hypothetical protein
MKKHFIIIFILICFNLSYPQFDFFYQTSHFGRPIGMGNTYIGIAEGIETTFYNSAGLPYIDYYGFAFSHGTGTQIDIDPTPFAMALVIPHFKNIGSFAFSFHHLNFWDNIYLMYRLHYGCFITDNLSLGTSVNGYYQKVNVFSLEEGETTKSSHTFDLSVSALYSKTNLILSDNRDVLRIGFQFNNIFASEVKRLIDITNTVSGSELIQSFGIGLSYKYIFGFEKIYDLTPLSLLIGSDFIFDNSLNHREYKFDRLNPNFGLELVLLEILFLRFGRENDVNLSDVEYTTPQYPVSRFGFGINLPMQRILKNKKEVFILFDYSYSKWLHEDEFPIMENKQKSSYTIQIRAKL